MAEELLVFRDDAGREHHVKVGPDGTASVDGVGFSVRAASDGSLHLTGPMSALVWTAAIQETRWIFLDGQVFTFELDRPVARRRPAAAHHATLMAPMPATVRKLMVAAGDRVRRNDVLIVLEAMKMELPVRAPADGQVVKVNCHEGELVPAGVSLIDLEDH